MEAWSLMSQEVRADISVKRIMIYLFINLMILSQLVTHVGSEGVDDIDCQHLAEDCSVNAVL